MTDLERENTLLKKELRHAKMERDIFKKVVGIFFRSDGESTISKVITESDLPSR